jgi:hypothetical protein
MTAPTVEDIKRSIRDVGQRTVDGKRFNLLWADGWQGAFDTEQAFKVLDELNTKAQIVAMGIDTFTEAEKFAYAVLRRHHQMTCGGS